MVSQTSCLTFSLTRPRRRADPQRKRQPSYNRRIVANSDLMLAGTLLIFFSIPQPSLCWSQSIGSATWRSTMACGPGYAQPGTTAAPEAQKQAGCSKKAAHTRPRGCSTSASVRGPTVVPRPLHLRGRLTCMRPPHVARSILPMCRNGIRVPCQRRPASSPRKKCMHKAHGPAPE